MGRDEALRLAEQQDLDLVVVAPDYDPPIAKITDWGKYNYRRTKQVQKNRMSSKVAGLKQIRFSLKIGEHDLQIKLNQAIKFLDEGHKVKFMIFYRGREQAHKDIGFQLAQRIIDQLNDRIVVDQQPTLAGKQLTFITRSNHNAKVKNS